MRTFSQVKLFYILFIAMCIALAGAGIWAAWYYQSPSWYAATVFGGFTGTMFLLIVYEPRILKLAHRLEERCRRIWETIVILTWLPVVVVAILFSPREPKSDW